MRADTRTRIEVLLGLLLILATMAAVLPAAAAASPLDAPLAAPATDGIIYTVQPGDRLVDIAARFGVTASDILHANNLSNPDVIYPGQRLTIPTSRSEPTVVRPSASRVPASRPATVVPVPTPVPSTGITDTTTAPVYPTRAPAVTDVPDARATTPGVPKYHTIQAGETLTKVARLYGISASALVRANGIDDPDLIYVGQRLFIPVPGAAVAPTATSVPGAPKPSPTAGAKPAPSLPKQTTYTVKSGDTLSKIARQFGVSVGALVEANALGSSDQIRVGMRLLIPGASSPAPVVGTASSFVASISRQRCWLYKGETILAEWMCSTGRRGSATRPGTYKIQSKMPKAFGSAWNIWMPYWLGIYWAGGSENGIHGLPWNAKTGAQVWTGYVGTPITYGCVMLDNVNAKMLYDMAYVGMPVIVRP